MIHKHQPRPAKPAPTITTSYSFVVAIVTKVIRKILEIKMAGSFIVTI